MARAVTFCLLVAALPTLGQSKYPTTEPILRLELGAHTGLINDVAVDPGTGDIATASDDKTIRIWSGSSGRLRKVFRVPIEQAQQQARSTIDAAGGNYVSNEGRLYAIAFSPDGRSLAVGGWTGVSWGGLATVYIISTEDGSILGTIDRLPKMVLALAYSPNGKRIYIGLTDGAGLRAYEVESKSLLWSDDRYGTGHVYGLDVARDGGLASASEDGFVRLYDNTGKIQAKRRLSAGSLPRVLKFSPDAKWIAVGFDDIPAIDLLDARTLTTMKALGIGKLTAWVNLIVLAWSPDSSQVFAGGERSTNDGNALVLWDITDPLPQRTFPTNQQRLTALAALPSGKLLYVTEDPALGFLDPEHPEKRLTISSPTFSSAFGTNTELEASTDCGTVAARSRRKPSDFLFGFSVRERALLKEWSDAGMRTSSSSEGNLTLDHWTGSMSPKLNGIPLALGVHERSRSADVSAQLSRVVIGADWSLRAFDSSGSRLWISIPSSATWAVKICEAARSVVALHSDGTIRWYRMEDGVEYMALFVHGNREDWIAWTPQGYYLSSNYGDQYVGWHLNRGKDKTPDFYRAVQFERVLYRPDIVEETFRSRGKESGTGTRALPRFDISKLSSIAPARVRLTTLKETASKADPSGTLQMQIDVEAASAPSLEDFAVYLNGIPMTRTSDRAVGATEHERFSRRVKLPLATGENDIRVEVSNGVSLGLAETYLPGTKGDSAPAGAGDLYVLAIGANRFADIPAERNANLLYAGRDAEMVVKVLRENATGLFGNVYTKLLNDRQESKPTKQEILKSLSFITQAGAQDTVVVFLASHGFSDKAGNYYFLPLDAKVTDIDSVLLGKDTTGKAASLVSWQEFFEVIRRTAGRRLLIVDTCEAKNMAGTFDAHSLKKRSAASMFALMVASQGNEKSQEYGDKRHGLFTYALLEGLRGQADIDHDGRVTLEEAFRFAVPMVERLRDKQEGPQTPDLITPQMLRVVPLTAGAGRPNN
jgi:WD40 repeat protein